MERKKKMNPKISNMRICVGEKQYLAQFQKAVTKTEKEKDDRTFIMCNIFSLEAWHGTPERCVGTGVAIINPCDKPNDFEGIRIAFARAVDKAFPKNRLNYWAVSIMSHPDNWKEHRKKFGEALADYLEKWEKK
jgi:hypothetical protein